MSRTALALLVLMGSAPANAQQVISLNPWHPVVLHTLELPVAGASQVYYLPQADRTLHAISWAAPMELPPEPLAGSQDPADGVYRQAREALNRSEYTRAVELFGQIRARYPRSAYVADSYYWEAFAQQRRGTAESLHQALALLRQQAAQHPDAATRGEARTLQIRIESALARQGDAASAAAMMERGSMIVAPMPPVPPVPPVPAAAPAPPVAPLPPMGVMSQGRRCEGEDEEQVMVLNGLLNMDPERAVPLLERVMARRDAASTCLRRRAVFLLGQKRAGNSEAILLAAIRSDPDPEVREQAILWLGQSGGPRAAAVLDSMLRTSTDPKVQVRALFSLAQMEKGTASASLRAFAGRADADREVREQALFWLGQTGTPEDTQFLQDLYRRERDAGLKDRIIFSVAQSVTAATRPAVGAWLAGIAANQQEPINTRKSALFWAGQAGAPLGDLIRAYDEMPDHEMKEQVIFVLSQRSEREATDKLIAIVRTERDAKLRERALFWLTQRNDPRVADLLIEILDRKPGGE